MCPFTYTPNVPQAETAMNTTQPQILENFKAISELVAVNHVGFNTNGVGFHNVVEMPYHAIPTTPEPSGINMFTAADSTPPASGPQIFGQYPTGKVFQISGVQPTVSGSGYCQFSSGVIMMWGTASSTSYKVTASYPVGAPAMKIGPVFAQASYNAPISGSPQGGVYVQAAINQLICSSTSGSSNNSATNISVNWFVIAF